MADPWDDVLRDADAPHLRGQLGSVSVESCVMQVMADRLAFLSWLKQTGSSKVGERQRLANALARIGRRQPPRIFPDPGQYNDANAALSAKDVAFITLSNSGYMACTLS